MTRAVVLLLAAALTLPAAATAQLRGRIEIRGGFVRARSVDPVLTAAHDGFAVGLRAGAALGTARLGLEMRYAEGRLTRDGADERDFVDVGLLAAAHPRSWLAVLVGPQAHAMSNGSGTRRWLFWTGIVRLESPRFGHGHAAVFGDIWLGVGSVNESDGTQLARGMEAGVLAWVFRTPLFARLAYRFHDGRLDDAGLRSTLESVELGIGYAF